MTVSLPKDNIKMWSSLNYN